MTPGTGTDTPPTPPAPATVSLRKFAALVPMPATTARDWRAAGRIIATRSITGRYQVPVDQLPAVRAALGLPPAPEATP